MSLSFGSLLRAQFTERPNRFVVWCRHPERGRIKAFMPNPGRMHELLLPGVTLYLRDHGPGDRATRYTVYGVERDGDPVFLHTHVNNAVARHLLDQRLIPGLKRITVVRNEARHGRSRFDFLVRQGGAETFLEVKSVTLFGNGVAMFPDAVTERGRRHLEELATLSTDQVKPVVLFLVHSRRVHTFLPDYHTDLAFSRTLYALRDHLRIMPVAVPWSRDLTIDGPVQRLHIPWLHLGRMLEDRGNFLVVARIAEPATIQWAGCHGLDLVPGYYLAVDYAHDRLDPSLARLGKRTRPLSMADALARCGKHVSCFPIRSRRDLTKNLCASLARHHAPVAGTPGLFASATDPRHEAPFHRWLESFRMAL